MDGLDDANAVSSLALDRGAMILFRESASSSLLVVEGASGDILDSSIVMNGIMIAGSRPCLR